MVLSYQASYMRKFQQPLILAISARRYQNRAMSDLRVSPLIQKLTQEQSIPRPDATTHHQYVRQGKAKLTQNSYHSLDCYSLLDQAAASPARGRFFLLGTYWTRQIVARNGKRRKKFREERLVRKEL